MNLIRTFICGVIIGIANVIPGVSGGTMAVILNIYDKILFACSYKNIKKNLFFLGTLVVGSIAGIFGFSGIITYLYENEFMIVNFCFIGLVLGSVPMIYEHAKFNKVKAKNWIPFILAFLFMIGISILKIMGIENAGHVNGVAALPMHWFFMWLFISAFISTIAMLLPGISGSFMMLLFGSYAIVMKAILDFDIEILTVTGLGVMSGGIVGIKLIKILLRRHPQAMYFTILGLVIGSLASIYPGFTFDLEGGLAFLGMLICAAGSYGFERTQRGDEVRTS